MSDASTGFVRFHPVVQPGGSDHDSDALNFSVYDIRDMRLRTGEDCRDFPQREDVSLRQRLIDSVHRIAPEQACGLVAPFKTRGLGSSKSVTVGQQNFLGFWVSGISGNARNF